MRELTWFPLLESYPKTSGYGQRIDPITGAASSFHGGVDYGAPYGVPLIAPFEGNVTSGYESGGAGNWLWVDNGPDRFKSFHHSEYAVRGGWVDAGQVIAYIGSTGASTGSHAHLELWDNGARIDPTGYLDRAPLLGYPPPGGADEMTEDDWNKMRSVLSNAIVSKLATHSTPHVLFTDSGGQFTLLMTDAGPRRYNMHSPAEVNLAKRVGWVAPQKPMNPPEPSPGAIEVADLSDEEREVLYSYPVVN
jgi:hypothetical protein